MAIIGRRSAQDGGPAGTTLLAEGTRFVGDLALAGSLHVDGEFEGEINADGEVSIGRSGVFQGTLHAQRLLVSGRLSGRVEADYLEIVDGGRVDGEVHVRELVIESGGRLQGASHMTAPASTDG